MGSNDTNGINAFHTSESQNLGCKKRKKVKIMMIHDILLYKEGISSNITFHTSESQIHIIIINKNSIMQKTSM